MIVVFISAAFVFIGSFNFQMWLWVPLFVITGSVATIKLFPETVLKPFVWLGVLSSALFVAHPITREIIIKMSYRGWIYTGLAVYISTSLLLAWLFKLLLKYIPKPKL